MFNKDGFFSAVEVKGDKRMVMVRARFPEDLDNASARISKKARTAIRSTPEADYPYRMSVLKGAWAAYVEKSAKTIDYPNFKGEVVPTYAKDPERSIRYHEVWAAMRGGF